jgi:pimeloyl-ACP methyl ester carboxylesterase
MEGRVVAADGRTLAYCAWGDPAGAPVFVLHGTPGSRLSRHPDETIFTAAGVRAITYDRAGYGNSTRNPGRRVADAAADVETIADELGLARFAVTGASGGGPHSLACGALLPERVTRCATVGGPAPLGPGGLSRAKFFDAMAEWNAQEFERAIAGEEALRPHLERKASDLLAGLRAAAQQPLGDRYDLSEQDREMVNRQAIGAMLAASIDEGIGRSVDGLVDDDLALTRPWGFDVSAMIVPVAVWYGPDDTLIPPTHGEWLAGSIPGAEVTVLDGGHFAVYDRLDQLLAWLAAGR